MNNTNSQKTRQNRRTILKTIGAIGGSTQVIGSVNASSRKSESEHTVNLAEIQTCGNFGELGNENEGIIQRQADRVKPYTIMGGEIYTASNSLFNKLDSKTEKIVDLNGSATVHGISDPITPIDNSNSISTTITNDLRTTRVTSIKKIIINLVN